MQTSFGAAEAPAWSGVVVPVCQCLANLVQGLCPEHYECSPEVMAFCLRDFFYSYSAPISSEVLPRSRALAAEQASSHPAQPSESSGSHPSFLRPQLGFV